MIPAVCLLALSATLAAQTTFSPTRHAGLPPLQSAVGFERGDIDNDGDVDLITVNDHNAIRLLLNDGNGMFADAPPGNLISPQQLDNHAVDLADIDGDGDLDLLVANEDFLPNYVFANNGAGIFTDVTATALPPQAFDTKNQIVADFDGDGDVDWLAVDRGGCHFYENTGTGVFFDASATRLVNVPQGLGYEYVPAPKATDLDGDGDLDVLVPQSLSTHLMLENTNGVLSPFPTQLPISAWAPLWPADIDGDGDIDLFSSLGRHVYENQGNAIFVEVTPTAFPVTPTIPGYDAFDVDRDGDVDVVANGGIWVNSGTGTFTWSSTAIPHLPWLLATVADDFDGDGDIDIPGMPNMLHHVLAPTAPAIGQSYSVVLHFRPGAPILAAVFGAIGSGTTPLGSSIVLDLDPASTLLVGLQFGTAPPTTLTWSIPNVPALAGTPLNYQAIATDPHAGLVVTNTFGDVVQ